MTERKPIAARISHAGQYHVAAVSTIKGSRAAIGFPIESATKMAAKRFANDTILELLPGWVVGVVTLHNGKRRPETWVLRREST